MHSLQDGTEVNELPKPIGEFDALQETRPQITKVSNEELIKLLTDNMYTTKEVAAFLKVENGTAFSRLRRMEKNGVIVRRWEGNRSWWVSAKAVGIEVPTPAPEEATAEASPEEA